MAKVQFGFARANALTSKQVSPLLIAGIVAWGVGALGHAYAPHTQAAFTQPRAVVEAVAPVAPVVAVGAPASKPLAMGKAFVTDTFTKPAQEIVRQVTEQITQTAPAQAVAAAAEALTPPVENVNRQIELDKGESFASMLRNADVADQDVSAVSDALNNVYEHRRLKAGLEVSLTFTRRGTEETLQEVNFQPELTKEITLTRAADGTFVGKAVVTPIERQRIAARAEIRSSLFEAGARENIPKNIMAALIRVYSHAVDFQRDIKPGDRFEVLYDQPKAKDGTPVGEGTIIYAALDVGGKIKPLYRVTFGDGTVDYFDAQGQSIKRALLRTPVDGARVTSGYGVRMHPLLGYSKMHKGVDFGAAMGTPIFAAGSGVIEEIGMKGAYGRYVRIRHNGHTQTAYAHMSRFARSVYQGGRVNQGDVIGFVGASGRATGPHLHFEVMVDGDQVNPLSVSMPMGRVLEGQSLNQFRQGEKRIQEEFSKLLSKNTAAVVPSAEPAAAPVAMAAQQQRPTQVASAKR